ncbi:hypothetical protein PsorP6_006844 [Peronosclerospora sorghi]|uniref:Uncharacterized protein n=1 Tax=Peronosclerospora sorghi TaxID=230839 RepID=A0ACC0W7H8_9STRA|nr:hypothetical protein PsorP6_006844 [Peronosclerospora sorghi]
MPDSRTDAVSKEEETGFLLCRATNRDIYKIKFAMKVEMLAGRLTPEALMESLAERQIMHSFWYNKRGAFTHLFVVPPTALEITSKFSAIIVFRLDSTYKTNR